MNKGILIGVIVVLSIFIFFIYNESVSLQEEMLIQRDNLNMEIEDLNSSLNEVSENYYDSQIRITELKALPLFNFNPSFKEVEEIVRKDQTDKMEYQDEFFDCKHFSFSLINAFLDEGVHACLHWISFEDAAGHSLVAVKTKDKGVVFIEPQSDKIISNLNPGDDYCKRMDWDCEWEILSQANCYNYRNEKIMRIHSI